MKDEIDEILQDEKIIESLNSFKLFKCEDEFSKIFNKLTEMEKMLLLDIELKFDELVPLKDFLDNHFYEFFVYKNI